MSQHYIEFGFGENDSAISQRNQRYKGEQGRTDRLSIAWWPIEDGRLNMDVSSPRFIGVQRVYIKDVGYVMATSPEIVKLAGQSPRYAIGTIIVKWPTNKDGIIDKRRVYSDFEVMPWVFGQSRYDDLKRLHKDWPLGYHDFTFACTDTSFQKGTLTPCKESLLRAIMDPEKNDEAVLAIRHRIVEGVQAIEKNIKNSLARELTLDQIREKLGMDTPMMTSSITTENVDKIVEDLMS